jgi:fructose-1-phosphate kinase PfkB-like protein
VLKKILGAGAGGAAISLGADGLVWQSGKEQQALFARIPRQASRFCVGSGDATLAGFAFAAQQGLLPVEALRLAAACGVANCLADGPGRARAGDIARLKDEISVETLA